MASPGAGADYVATVKGLIFGPTLAYGMQVKDWGAEITAKLDLLYPKDGKTHPTVSDVEALAQIIADAIEAGDITPAPVFKTYKGTDDLTTSVTQGTDEKAGITAGAQISVVNLSGTFGYDQTTNSSAQQNHHLEYEVDVPLQTADVLQRVAAGVRNWMLLRGITAAPGAPAAPAP